MHLCMMINHSATIDDDLTSVPTMAPAITTTPTPNCARGEYGPRMNIISRQQLATVQTIFVATRCHLSPPIHGALCWHISQILKTPLATATQTPLRRCQMHHRLKKTCQAKLAHHQNSFCHRSSIPPRRLSVSLAYLASAVLGSMQNPITSSHLHKSHP